MKYSINKLKKTGSRALLLPVILCCLIATKGSAQIGCGIVDLQAVSISPDIPVIAKNQTATIFVTMKNNGPFCFIPIGEATAQVSLSSVYFDLAVPFNFVSTCGQWSFVGSFPTPGSHNLFFRNNAGPIPVGGPFCGFQFNIGGKAITPVPSTISLASSLHATATNTDGDGSNQAATADVLVSFSVLPVSLADFSVTASSCNGVLNWRTLSEDKVKNFEIEYSNNGVQFTKVGAVQSKNSATGSTYKYVNNQGTAKGFYRLKVVDIDGQFSYSRIVSVDTKCSGVKTISMYPNPLTANQALTIIASGYEGSIKGELVSMSGQVIRSYSLKNGTNTLPVDKLAQATYLLRVTDASGESESFRVVIIN